jgi:hypothetical protein
MLTSPKLSDAGRSGTFCRAFWTGSVGSRGAAARMRLRAPRSGARQPRHRVAQRPGAHRQPDLGELGRRLGGGAEDVPAVRRLGPGCGRRGRDARRLGGLGQTVGPAPGGAGRRRYGVRRVVCGPNRSGGRRLLAPPRLGRGCGCLARRSAGTCRGSLARSRASLGRRRGPRGRSRGPGASRRRGLLGGGVVDRRGGGALVATTVRPPVRQCADNV